MILLRGYKGELHEVKLGYLVADENGRGGTVVDFQIDENYTDQKVIVLVETREGSIIELRESEVSFTASPEMEVM